MVLPGPTLLTLFFYRSRKHQVVNISWTPGNEHVDISSPWGLSRMTLDRCAFSIRQAKLAGCRVSTTPGWPGKHEYSSLISVAWDCQDDLVWSQPVAWKAFMRSKPKTHDSERASGLIEKRRYFQRTRAVKGPQWKSWARISTKNDAFKLPIQNLLPELPWKLTKERSSTSIKVCLRFQVFPLLSWG